MLVQPLVQEIEQAVVRGGLRAGWWADSGYTHPRVTAGRERPSAIGARRVRDGLAPRGPAGWFMEFFRDRFGRWIRHSEERRLQLAEHPEMRASSRSWRSLSAIPLRLVERR
jgi:hypothetical protein